MRRGRLVCGLVMPLVFTPGCDEADGPDDADLGALVESARGKQDGFGIETELGATHDLSVVPKPRGAATRPENARALVFTVDAGQTFAVVMRGGTGGDFEPWLQLHAPEGALATSDWDQAIVADAHESDAAVVAHASERTEYIAVVADLDLAVTADFQVDLLALDAPAPTTDLTMTSPGTRALLDHVRQTQAKLVSPDAVREDGSGSLVVGEDTPLADRPKIDAANAARHEYFEGLADMHEVSADELRAIIGPLWAALAEDEYRQR